MPLLQSAESENSARLSCRFPEIRIVRASTRPVAFYISLTNVATSYAEYESAIQCFLIPFHRTLVKIMPLESADDDHVMTEMSDALR